MEPASGTNSTIGRRYQLAELIGRGGMGSVYRAWDQLARQHVALKRVTQSTDETKYSSRDSAGDFRLALAREFRFLASLRHPNIIEVLDYGFDQANQPYYTMELLEDASTILAFGQRISFIHKLKLLVQTLQALSYLHRRGILHRDLKPANVMVVNGEIKLLDFGLSIMRYRVEADEPENTTAGTLAYMAPEILVGNPASPAADLYSIGMLGIELLVGKHPFSVSDLGTLINQILYTSPTLDSTNLDTEIALILDQLVHKEPSARFQSAEDVIIAIQAAVVEPIERETMATRESFLQAARLIGRDQELAQLSSAVEQLQYAQGSVWIVTGESGVGKSRILDELRTIAMVRGALVIRGQTLSEGGFPFCDWQSLLRWLPLIIDLTPTDAQLIGSLILDEALPDSGSITPNTRTLSPQHLQTRLVTMVKEMIQALRQPVVLIFEDLQWAGSESISLLQQVCEIVYELPVLVITSQRSDEKSVLTAQLPGAVQMHLSRLDETGIAELGAAMIGEAGTQPQVINLLQRETEGNVFFLIEVVRALAEEAGTLDEIGKMTLPENVFAGGIQRIIQRRMESIPDWGLKMLQTAAVYGRQLDLTLLNLLFPDMDMDRWLLACSEVSIIEMNESEWRFSHDRMRETLLENLSSTERNTLHQDIASAIETMYNSQDYASLLAHHWNMAGAIAKERYYLMLAGEQALRSGAFHEAIRFFDRALILIHDEEATIQHHHDRATLQQKQGEAHLGLGEYTEAAAIIEQSRVNAEQLQDRRVSGTAYNLLGSIAQTHGDHPQARQYFQNALEEYQTAEYESGIAAALHNLGNVAYDLGEDDLAHQLYQQSLQVSRRAGEQWGMAGAIANEPTGYDEVTKFSLTPQHELASYESELRRSLVSAVQLGQTSLVLKMVYNIARVRAMRDQKTEALEIVAVLLHHPGVEGAGLEDAAEQLAYELQTTLTPDEANHLWERSKTIQFSTFIQQLLGEN